MVLTKYRLEGIMRPKLDKLRLNSNHNRIIPSFYRLKHYSHEFKLVALLKDPKLTMKIFVRIGLNMFIQYFEALSIVSPVIEFMRFAPWYIAKPPPN